MAKPKLELVEDTVQQIIPIAFAELHNPLFLAGRNHKEKLYMNTQTELKLAYNATTKQLYVNFKNEVALIPENNVSSMTPQDSSMFLSAFDGITANAPKQTHIHHSSNINAPIVAQVSTPTTTVQNPR